MRLTRRYLVTGRVQGVGFRFFVADCARREGLSGHVRNLPDGAVEAVADGDLDSLTRLEAALWRGPSHARVDDVVIADIEPQGLADGFSIR
jgi:acylphosphatase